MSGENIVFYVEDDDRFDKPWQLKLHWNLMGQDITIMNCDTHYEALFRANEANKSLVEDDI